MRIPVTCGVDVGSSNAKVVALDAEGAVVARVARPTPRDPETLSIDAQALFKAIEEMVKQICGDLYVVHAVCSVGVGEDGVLVDAGLKPLTRAMAWFDPRRRGIFRTLEPLLKDDDSFDTKTDQVRTLVGWKWATAQSGALEAYKWVALADWAGVMWTGRSFMSETLASRTAAWRSSDRKWSTDRVMLTLGSETLLPPVVLTGGVIGDLLSRSLADAGVVAADAIVVSGGHDHPIAGWGVHRLIPGAILDSMGTAEVVVAQTHLIGAGRRNGVDVAPGIGASGTTLLHVEELARNVQWASQDPDVAEGIRQILDGRVLPEPVLEDAFFLPGKSGGGRPRYALGAPRHPHGRASAVLGALATAGRDAVLTVREAGADSREVRLTGGWVRSPGWLDIKSAVNGYHAPPILEPEVTAVSAALLAASARGWSPDPARALGGFSAGLLNLNQLAETLTSSGMTSVRTHVS